jgi:hypothetical protein
MSNVTIDLPPHTEKKLRENAAREGQSLESFLVSIAERPVSPPDAVSFERLTTPIADAVAASGMSDRQVEELLEEVVDEVSAES